MLDYYDARLQLLEKAQKHLSPTQECPLLECAGLALAHDLTAQHDSPPFSNSAMDGYALCFDPNYPIQNFHVIDRITAGEKVGQTPLQIGQAVRIFTGAAIPPNSTAVIAQENTQREAQQLTCLQTIRPHSNIRHQGEEFLQRQTIITRGTVLNAAAVGIAASQGYTKLNVHMPLRVTVFSSGNELLEPHEPLQNGRIYDANRYQMLTWLKQLGCIGIDGGILPDHLNDTVEQLKQAARHCDIIITSGGASVGEEDHLKNALLQIGQLTHWKLLIKPGKPFAWGQIDSTMVMMLPGNPVAAFATFKMLVEPALRVCMGICTPQALPLRHYALADFSSELVESRREFLRAVYWQDEQGTLRVSPLAQQGSNMLLSCVQSNCLIELSPKQTVTHNDVLPIYPLRS